MPAAALPSPCSALVPHPTEAGHVSAPACHRVWGDSCSYSVSQWFYPKRWVPNTSLLVASESLLLGTRGWFCFTFPVLQLGAAAILLLGEIWRYQQSPWTGACLVLTAAATGDVSSCEQESQGGRGFVPW